MQHSAWRILILGCSFLVSPAARLDRRNSAASLRAPLGSEAQPVLSTSCGVFEGTWAYPDDKRSPAVPVAAYRGIRFGSVPRWLPPEAYCLSPVTRINAKNEGPLCPEKVYSANEGKRQEEECLYLNLFVPKDPAGEQPLPILVFIHGGGLNSGWADSYTEGPQSLAQLWMGQVVVVSCQYRLGALGWMSIPDFDKLDPRGTSGNYGTLDQLLCLEWVRTHASEFGADADRITVMGHSSGATSALLFATGAVPAGQDLVKGAISLSPAPGSPKLSHAQKQKQDMLYWLPATGCGNQSDVLGCLLKMSPQDLVSTLPESYQLFNCSDYPVVPEPKGRIPWHHMLHVDGVTIQYTLQGAVQANGRLHAPVIGHNMQAEMVDRDFNGFATLNLTTDKEWLSFLDSKFASGFGHAFPPEVAKEYEAVTPHLLAAYNLDSDTGTFCGLVELSKSLATQPADGPPFYIARVSAGPAYPILWEDCSAPPIMFAFHGWEVAAATERWNQLWGMCEVYVPNSVDMKLARWLRQIWLDLVLDGSLGEGEGSWPAAAPRAAQDGPPGFQTFRQDGQLEFAPLTSTTCEFWESHNVGFNWYWSN